MKRLTLPGLIDPHVHLSDSNQTEKEDFLTRTTQAVAGGYTTVLDVPDNQTPVLTTRELKRKKQEATEEIVCNIGFFFGSHGDNLDEFPAAVKLGVYGLKLSLNRTTGDFVRSQKDLLQLFRAWPTELPILLDTDEEMFTAALAVLRKFPRKIHVSHLSTRFELEAVMQAKAEGLPVTCGVTLHHLFLTRSDEKHLGPYGKMLPILQSSRDVAFLWKHLRAIDCVESDYVPHARTEQKHNETRHSVSGLETTIPLLLTAAAEGRLELHDIVRLCHDGPARIFNVRQSKGTYVEIDLQKTYTLENKKLVTTSGWTPFHGRSVQGRILRTVISERAVFENGLLLAPAGSGTVL